MLLGTGLIVEALLQNYVWDKNNLTWPISLQV